MEEVRPEIVKLVMGELTDRGIIAFGEVTETGLSLCPLRKRSAERIMFMAIKFDANS